VPGEGPGIPLVTCGTTASSRGRAPEEGRNSFGVVTFLPHAIEVVPWLSEGEGHPFLPGPPELLPRGGGGDRDAGASR